MCAFSAAHPPFGRKARSSTRARHVIGNTCGEIIDVPHGSSFGLMYVLYRPLHSLLGTGRFEKYAFHSRSYQIALVVGGQSKKEKAREKERGRKRKKEKERGDKEKARERKINRERERQRV